MTTAADGTNFTGTVTIYVTGDSGTQTIGSVGSGICTHEGRGYHSYAPAQAETNFNHIAFTFEGTGAITRTVQVFTNFPQSGDSFPFGAPPSVGAIADQVWDEATAGHTTSGSTGKALIDMAAAADVSAIADAVWDEDLTAHAIAGSTGEALSAAGTAGDPWITELPGAYALGSAGQIIGDLIAETESAITTYGALKPTVANRTLDVTAAGTAGIDWANVENQDTPVDLENTTISETQIVATVTGNVNGSVGSVLTGGIGELSLDEATLNSIADAILKRDFGLVSGEASRSLLNALRYLRNKRAVLAGTLTVTKEDDSTTAWEAATIGTPGAAPITSVDPT